MGLLIEHPLCAGGPAQRHRQSLSSSLGMVVARLLETSPSARPISHLAREMGRTCGPHRTCNCALGAPGRNLTWLVCSGARHRLSNFFFFLFKAYLCFERVILSTWLESQGPARAA